MEKSTVTVDAQAVSGAILRACAAVEAQHEYLTGLDQAVGDGDLGITFSKIAAALADYVRTAPKDDLGKFLASAGMAANRAGSSTLGTLLATALMRMGKVAMGQAELTPTVLVEMVKAAGQGVQERGKAKLGDKTVVDALQPAVEAFASAMEKGVSLKRAGLDMLAAAEAGRDQVTPLQSRMGRAAWVGERTIGKVDPGCAALVMILKAIILPDE
ncbi:MAG: dihydroxyacetone kinase subunit L [Omnitrophica WOR_2 bacterium]